ncbi:MAG TPA: tetratricopeptide repeat protein, partial [Phycisphaerae bacterium]|nr:tetratricopeptide repeat protein [Phycisphaerae bacterium]
MAKTARRHSEPPVSAAQSAATFWRSIAFPAGLILTLFVVYLPAIRAGYIWDDDDYVYKNPLLSSPDGFQRIWSDPAASPQYYPLVFSTFWLESRLWGLAPMGFHLVNIALHGLASLLLWRILRFLQIPLAWFVAGLFALHPIQVESVAWITERKNVLCGVFYFASALCFLRFDSSGPAIRSRRQSLLYLASLTLFVCALFSKTIACSLPAALALIIWWKRGKLTTIDCLRLLPMFLLGLAAALMTAWFERSHVGATGAAFDLSAAQRILIAGRAIWFYVGKILWPHSLIFIYPRWVVDPRQWTGWIYPLTAAALLTCLWAFRTRLGRGPLVGCLLFAGTLVPALGFINVYPMRYSFVADHFQYLAAPAVFLLLATLVAWASSRLSLNSSITTTGCLAILAVLCMLTSRQCVQYKDEPTLWRATLDKDPRSWTALNNLGFFLAQSGDSDQGLDMMRRALVINPEYAEGHSNLGAFLVSRGQLELAMRELETAIRLDPKLSGAHSNLGAALVHAGRMDDAIKMFYEAIRLNPANYDARFNLG